MSETVGNIWNKIKMPLLVLSAIIPLLGLLKSPADPLLPIYSVFVFLYLLKKRFYSQQLQEAANPDSPLKFPFLIVIVGLIAESLAWGVNFLARRENPPLFHPQLVYDLMIALAMYVAWAIVWFFWSKRYTFSLKQVFIIQGIYGVVLEQQGAIFIQGLLQMPVGIFFWIYVFVVYGSITGLAYILSGNAFKQPSAGIGLKKQAVILLSLAIISFILVMLWGLILKITGVIPQPMPIWLRPLW